MDWIGGSVLRHGAVWVVRVERSSKDDVWRR